MLCTTRLYVLVVHACGSCGMAYVVYVSSPKLLHFVSAMDQVATQALRVALREEEPHEVQQLKLDVERVRMEAEDLRSAAVSPHAARTPPYDASRVVTWKEYAKDL